MTADFFSTLSHLFNINKIRHVTAGHQGTTYFSQR
jgi:hypothetical protein